MSCAVLPGCSALDVETDPAVPPPPSEPEHSELCVLIEPHVFSPGTLGFFGTVAPRDPGVASDLDWIVDVFKARRCLCTEDRQGCRVVDRKGAGLGTVG